MFLCPTVKSDHLIGVLELPEEKQRESRSCRPKVDFQVLPTELRIVGRSKGRLFLSCPLLYRVGNRNSRVGCHMYHGNKSQVTGLDSGIDIDRRYSRRFIFEINPLVSKRILFFSYPGTPVNNQEGVG